MHITTRTLVALTAMAVAIGPALLSASDRESAPKVTTKAVSTAHASGQFATLKGIKAVPMSSSELKAVKGQHEHFVTINSNNTQFGPAGLHMVNIQNKDHWSDLYGGGLVAPGYHGLCRAALNSPNMFIPGQSTITGHGGGC